MVAAGAWEGGERYKGTSICRYLLDVPFHISPCEDFIIQERYLRIVIYYVNLQLGGHITGSAELKYICFLYLCEDLIYNMKRKIISAFMFLLCGNILSARNLVINLYYSEKELSFDSLVMEKTLSEIGYDMISYIIDKNRSISEQATRVQEITERYREGGTQDVIFLLSDRLSTFVGLDVLSKDTNIHGLITLNGAYNDGESFLYDDVSIKKNLEMIDFISFDGSKERYLMTVYKMIRDKKKGKEIKLAPKADNMMLELYTLLNSPYGTSLMNFSLEEHLCTIKSWIGFLIEDGHLLEMENDFMNLSWIANKYGVKYTYPNTYRSDDSVAKVKKMILDLQQKN